MRLEIGGRINYRELCASHAGRFASGAASTLSSEGQKVIPDALPADSPTAYRRLIPHFSFLIAAAQILPRQTHQPPSGGTHGLR